MKRLLPKPVIFVLLLLILVVLYGGVLELVKGEARISDKGYLEELIKLAVASGCGIYLLFAPRKK